MDAESAEQNIAHYLPEVAAALPGKCAVLCPVARDAAGRVAYTHLTFARLNELCDRYAHGLGAIDIERGSRVLVMVRPSLDFFALTFALFKLGAVPVLIDPGMGWPSFLRCVAQVRPRGFIGIPAAHILRLVCRRSFRSVRVLVTLGRRLFWGGCSVTELPGGEGAFPVTPVAPGETAAVLFTTGSTGPAKGVVYTHRMFCTQTEILRREYGITPKDVDLPCFPLFALFSTALGATAVIPEMDPSRPAFVNPARIVEAVRENGVTYSFGSPTLWDRVSAYCVERDVALPTLRRVLMAGAPVPGRVHERLLGQVLPAGAETYTPYGATEALPVANFTGSEMLASTWAETRRGAGMCVGRPLREVELRIIRITDDELGAWDDGLVLPAGEIGEIVVRGGMVSRDYDHLADATRLAKIRDGEGFWHRMGDVGYLDRLGRVWFCGRKGHRVETKRGTLFTVPCEAVFNEHIRVYRSALVGIGTDQQRQTPVLVVEPEAGAFPWGASARQAFVDELLALGAESELTRAIRHVLFRRRFPVDIRHNAKIRREVLARWAATRLAKTGAGEPLTV